MTIINKLLGRQIARELMANDRLRNNDPPMTIDEYIQLMRDKGFTFNEDHIKEAFEKEQHTHKLRAGFLVGCIPIAILALIFSQLIDIAILYLLNWVLLGLMVIILVPILIYDTYLVRYATKM